MTNEMGTKEGVGPLYGRERRIRRGNVFMTNCHERRENISRDGGMIRRRSRFSALVLFALRSSNSSRDSISVWAFHRVHSTEQATPSHHAPERTWVEAQVSESAWRFIGESSFLRNQLVKNFFWLAEMQFVMVRIDSRIMTGNALLMTLLGDAISRRESLHMKCLIIRYQIAGFDTKTSNKQKANEGLEREGKMRNIHIHN